MLEKNYSTHGDHETLLSCIQDQPYYSAKPAAVEDRVMKRVSACTTLCLLKMDVFWVVAPCSLVEFYQRFRGPCCLHHQGVRPETLVKLYQTTRCYDPEDISLHTHRRENLKSYLVCLLFAALASADTATIKGNVFGKIKTQISVFQTNFSCILQTGD
jgi:hypothetical protein